MELSEYNGWENKFTWLVHLHLSNEASLMDEITTLVASEPNDTLAGRQIEMWVRATLTNWLTGLPGRVRLFDESMRLLAWDFVGSALANADWDALVALLTGEIAPSDNLFTMTLYHGILNHRQFQQHVGALIHGAPNKYACADALKDWFEVQVDTWISTRVAYQQKNAPISLLVSALIENSYAVICWEHVARAFQPGY